MWRTLENSDSARSEAGRRTCEQRTKLLTHPQVEGADGGHYTPPLAPLQHLCDQGAKDAFAFAAARCVKRINNEPGRSGAVPSLQYL